MLPDATQEKCLNYASICHQQAEFEPEGATDHWVKAAAEWMGRAERALPHPTATHEVHKGRLIPNPP
jgi:hypothetical protein